MTDVFISYKREERAKARMLADALIAQGLAVWWDAEMPPGEKYREYTLKILESCRAALVIWSPLSMKSSWVQDEAQRALERDVLIPVFLEPIEKVPLGFGQLHTHDLTEWTGDANASVFQPVVTAVRRLVGTPPPAPGSEAEIALWRGIQDSRNPADFEAYLAHYKDGVFATLARSRLDTLCPATAHQPRPGSNPAKPHMFASQRAASPSSAGASPPFTRGDLGFIAAAALIAPFPLWLLANLALGVDAFFADDMTGMFRFDQPYNIVLLAPVMLAFAWAWDRGAAWWTARGKLPNLPRYIMLAVLGVAFILSLRMLENNGRETHFVLWLAATWAAALAARRATAWLLARTDARR